MKRNEMKVIESITLNDIREFKAENDAVVMVLKEGQEIVFKAMQDAFDRFYFYDLFDRIKVTKKEMVHSNFIGVNGFVIYGNYHLKLNEIAKTCGTEDPADAYSRQIEREMGTVNE